MKRTSERFRESFRTSKRFRRQHLSDQHTKSLNDISAETYEPPFEGHLERRTATEVYQNAENSPLEGYLDLKVFMRWHIPGDKFRIHGESREGGLLVRYEICFAGSCYEHLSSIGLVFDVGDHVCISLQGASLQKMNFTTPKMLSNFLLYRDGVKLQFISKKTPLHTGSLVDTWSAPNLEPINTVPASADVTRTASDDWFATPPTAITERKTYVQMAVDLPLPEHEATTNPTIPLNEENDERANDQHADTEPKGQTSSISAPTALGRVPDDKPGSSIVPRSPVLSAQLETTDRLELVRAPSPGRANPPMVQEVQQPKPLYRDSNRGKRGRIPPLAQPPVSGSKGTEPVVGQQNAADKASNHASKKAEKKAKRNARRAGASVENSRPSTEAEQNQVVPEVPSVTGRNLVVPENSSVKPIHEEPPELAPVSLAQPPEPAHTTSTSATSLPKQLSPGPHHGNENPVLQDPAPSTSKVSQGQSHSGQSISDDLLSGCRPADSVAQYLPLKDLQRNTRQNFIGIVLSVNHGKTSIGQYSQRLLLVDASIYDKSDPETGFGVNCFAMEERNLIPDVRKGDIILLRSVQVTAHSGRVMGVAGSSMPWTWSLFRPSTGDTAPARQAFKLSPEELNYCIRLGDWWRAAEEERLGRRPEPQSADSNTTVHVHDLAAVGNNGAANPWRREHRLIQDASPDAPPRGFFDCTVEVVKTHENFNGVWSVYVTDYTKNELLPPIDASWSDPSLANSILKIEMWEQAAEAASKMQSGEYYALKNTRMRTSNGGYTEGTMSEAGAKIRKLDADELEGEVQLVELLRRKGVWERALAEQGGYEHLPHKLFKDADLDELFECTVFVLQVSLKEERAFIYVTDYTKRSDLTVIPPSALWTQDVGDDYIVKVLLMDEAFQAAKTLNVGDYIAIRKVRLKAAIGDHDVSARVSGEEPLIFKLDPEESGNHNLRLLIKRKKAWERQVNSRRYTAAAARHGPARPIILPTAVYSRKYYEELGAFTIKELRAHSSTTAPAIFRPVVARIVDFFPEHIEDCVILRCTQCHSDIPPRFKICTKCDDSMETNVRPFYRFSFQIEDEEGERLCVSAGNPGSNYLKDLPPEDLRDDDEALETFTDRLTPYLGDLISEHSKAINNAEDGRVRSDNARPLFKMVIAKLPAGDSGADFCFLEIDPKPL